MQLPAESANRTTRYLMTAEAVRALEAELEELRARRQRGLAERLEEARASREAPEPDQYREPGVDERLIDARIARIEELLSRAHISDPGVHGRGTARLGSLVRVKDATSGRVSDYRIVAFDGSGLPPGAVSASSPVGQALMGVAAGELATVELPDGRTRALRVLAVSRR